MIKRILSILVVLSLAFGCNDQSETNESSYDLIVYGSTSSGIIAAYTARMKGLDVLLVSPNGHIGGLTTGGLGYTDIGNKYAISGLAKDFYRRIGSKYGAFERWIFEPNVATEVFGDYLKEANIEVLNGFRLSDVNKTESKISSIKVEQATDQQITKTLSAEMFIDATYEGDLMAKSGVSYVVGRESNDAYAETYNGVQLRKKHQFPDNIDPYKVEGDPNSGLLWGISPIKVEEDGTGDEKLQAYNFRICLTNVPENRVEITRPDNYDSSRYELLLRLFLAQPNKRKLNDFFIWSKMPGGKTDINNRGGFSTDMIGMNYDYPEGSYEEREAIIQAHENYTKGLLYFYKTDPRVPAELQAEIQQWGYPKDEYTNNGNWSPQLYVREVRRMVGQTVMTQHHCQGREVVSDPVAMAAYTMDSHNCQRVVVKKDGVAMVKNEGNVEIGGFGPYPISYGAIIPKATECENLLVPVCLSASHIAYGSIRMEPVFMALGQVAALAANEAIDNKISVQKVDYRSIKSELDKDPLSDASTPEILVDNIPGLVGFTGNWKEVNKDCYGESALEIEGKGEVVFKPSISISGAYEVFVYFSKLEKVAPVTKGSVSFGELSQNFEIVADDIEVIGQTSGEWVSIGVFDLSKEAANQVSIYGSEGGVVRGDAVLLVPKTGIK
ncbi:MAG: FAD-dependent oxidoreductase [Cyclobacteriaceae bacterium]